MMQRVSDCLSEQHLLLFGIVIRWFARYELLIQQVMATVAGADCAAVMLLTKNLDFGEKRETFLNLLRHRTTPLDQYDQINDFLMVPHTLTRLRNDIAHADWIAGPSPNSIQPDWILRPSSSVKPLYDGRGADGKKDVECEEDKTVFTIEDLNEAIDSLAGNYAGFSGYLHEIGLI